MRLWNVLALRYGKPAKRINAIEKLARDRGARTIGLLRAALDDTSAEVRDAAACHFWLLAREETASILEFDDSPSSLKQALLDAANRAAYRYPLAKEYVAGLVMKRVVSDPDPSVRTKARAAIRKLTDDEYQPYSKWSLITEEQAISLLSSPDKDTCIHACEILGAPQRLGNRRADLGSARCVPSLLKAITRDNGELRKCALYALASLKYEDRLTVANCPSHRILSKLLVDEDVSIRKLAQTICDDICPKLEREALTRMLTSDAMKALLRLPDLKSTLDILRCLDHAHYADVVLEVLETCDPTTAVTIIRFLGTQNVLPAAPALRAFLTRAPQSGEHECLKQAITALGKLKDLAAVEDMLKLLSSNKDAELTELLVNALGSIGDASVVPAIESVITSLRPDEHAEVSKKSGSPSSLLLQSLDALALLGRNDLAIFYRLTALGHKDYYIRSVAWRGSLYHQAEDNAFLRDACGHAIARKAITSLVHCIVDGYRTDAVRALAAIHPQWWATAEADQALPYILDALARVERVVKEEPGAITALKLLKNRRAIPALIRFAVDPERNRASIQYENRHLPSPMETAVRALEAIDPDWPASVEAMSVAPELVARIPDSNVVKILGMCRFSAAALPLLDIAPSLSNAAGVVSALKAIVCAHLSELPCDILKRCGEIRNCTTTEARPVYTFVEDGADYTIQDHFKIPLPAEEKFLSEVKAELTRRRRLSGGEKRA